MTRVLLAVVLVVLGVTCVACGPQQRVSQCSPSATTGDKPPVLVMLEGETASVEMLLPPAVFCQEGNPIASSVGTEVLSAANQSLAHTQTEPTSSDTRGYATTVTFTPGAPGVYFLTARFEPSLGIARRQVQVVANRLSETPSVRAAASGTCDDVVGLEPFAVCLRGSELSVVTDGGAAYAESNVQHLVAAERTAWWWTPTTVTRAVSVNGVLSRVTTPLAMSGGATSVSAEVLAQMAAPVVVVKFDGDGGLNVSSRAAPELMSVASVCREGEVFGFAAMDSLCAMTDSTADGSVRCVPSVGLVPAASEANVMWLRGAETGVVAMARVTQPPLRDPEVLFLEGQASAMIDTKQPMPAFNWNGKFLSVRRQDLTLEAWQPPTGVMKRWVTAEHVVFQTRDELILYRR